MGVISDISVICASTVTIIGIVDWRRTLFAKKRADLAEEVLASFYEIEESIKYARNGFSFGHEGLTRPGREDESDDDVRRLRDSYFVPLERLDKKQELVSRIYALKYRYQVLFEAEDKPFRILNSIFGDFNIAVRKLIRESERPPERMPQQQAEAHDRRCEEGEDVIWEANAEVAGRPDPIQPKVDEMISMVEEVCRPYIASTLPIWMRWWRWCKDQLSRLMER